MDKRWAKEWREQLRAERNNKEKEAVDLGKEIGKLNLKIAVLERVETEKWPTKVEEFGDGLSDEVVSKCNNEKTRLKKERDEKNKARFNLETEIELWRRMIKTLENMYGIEEVNED